MVRYSIIVLLVTVWSCRSDSQAKKHDFETYEFAILDGEPIFEDEYLFEKQKKKCLIEKNDKIELYYCDWNNNADFKEVGVDYIGVKSKLDSKPTIVMLSSITYISINGIEYGYRVDEDSFHEMQETNSRTSNLNIVTKLHPILLENGDFFLPEIKNDSTVIYFWATWCRPCVETLKSVNVKELEENGIDFIPIAYNCSGSKEFIKKNNLKFQDYVVSEDGATDYNIKSLPTKFTFLKNDEISDKNVDLKNYFR